MKVIQFFVKTSHHSGACSPNFEDWILMRLLATCPKLGEFVDVDKDPPYSISIDQAKVILWLLDQSQPKRKLARMRFQKNSTGLVSEAEFRSVLGRLRTFFRVNLGLAPCPPQ
jgi:hypothetical protein